MFQLILKHEIIRNFGGFGVWVISPFRCEDLRHDPLAATPSFVVKHVVTTTTLVRTDGRISCSDGARHFFERAKVFEGKMGKRKDWSRLHNYRIDIEIYTVYIYTHTY